METQQSQPNQVVNNGGPGSFKLYTGKAPLLLQIVGGLMWLSGLSMIIKGIPLLLVFGLGIIPIILGVLCIKYGSAIFKMHKKGYVGAMVLNILSLLFTIIGAVLSGGNFVGIETYLSLGGPVLFIVILYSYREKFVG